jgi:hypothetical protein
MITGAFVAQGAIDDDKVWGRAGRGELARRREAEQEPTAVAGEQFFGDENVEAERRASQHAGAESSDEVVAFGREEIAVERPRDAGAGGEASAAQNLAGVKPRL